MPDDMSSTRVGGRPSFEPTQSQRQMVEAMAGVPEADIAVVIGIAPKTLRKHFRDELDTGHIKASAKVADNPYRIATGRGPRGGNRGDILVEGESRMAGAARCARVSDGKERGPGTRC